jgi:hypothetical protein
MDNFHFILGLLMPVEHIVQNGCDRVEIGVTKDGSILLDLFFNQ